MRELEKDIVIIGAGPAGLAAAVAAHDGGVTDIVVLERDSFAGGILNQCIHNGFGLHTFGEELTGPEYAARFWEEAQKRDIECAFETTVLSVDADKCVTAVGRGGTVKYKAKAVVFACGCRERPRGAINIAGTRPAGVFSAGTAQRLINIDGEKITVGSGGGEVFILGSGDIGLIMARRMVFEGAHVAGVAELMPYSSGLRRNIVLCLEDYGIPLYFNTTVVEIKGKERLTGVTIATVDENKKPIKGTERDIPCDTLLLSVGLLPENELARAAGVEMSRVTGGASVDDRFMTDVDGIFMCGNCLHVHDLVDYVSAESGACGAAAAEFVKAHGGGRGAKVNVITSGGIRYCVPQDIRKDGRGKLTLRMRVDGVYRKCNISVYADGKAVYSKPRPIVAPGEMETVELNESISASLRRAQSIEIRLEKNGNE